MGKEQAGFSAPSVQGVNTADESPSAAERARSPVSPVVKENTFF